MANVTLNSGTGGATMATEQNASVPNENYQIIEIASGAPAASFANKLAITAANAAKVDGSGVVQPVSDNGANLHVQGGAASGATAAGNPVQIGGVFNTAQPTVTTGQAVQVQASARGELLVAPGVSGFSVNAGTNLNTSALALETGGNLAALVGRLPATTALADATANPTLTSVQVYPMGYNGTTWDRLKSTSGSLNVHLDAQTVTVSLAATSANQGTAAALAGAWPVKVTDGTNTLPTGDANTRPIHVELDAQVGTGYTPGTLVAAATNNLTTVKASSGTLGYLSGSNNAAYPLYIKVFDGSPTMGTTNAIAQWEIPANATAANGSGREVHLPPQGLKFSTGIYLALTKGQALNDNTAVAASDGTVTWGYV